MFTIAGYYVLLCCEIIQDDTQQADTTGQEAYLVTQFPCLGITQQSA